MSRYLQKKFALGRQGGKNLTRAIFACALTNIGLMLPVGLLFLFTQRLFGPLVGLGTPQMGLGGYVGTSVLILAVIFGLEYIQYVATFISSYAESADMRIRIAERLRKLPLSFFGKRDLADLTTTIMSDCTFVETAFSHFIPELIGAVLSTALIGAGLLAADWRMGLSVLWVAPVSFFLAAGTRPMVDRIERRQKGKKIAASDGIQECIENIQDIRANNRREAYLPENRHGDDGAGRSFPSGIRFHRFYGFSDVHAGSHQTVHSSERLPAESVRSIFDSPCGRTDEGDRGGNGPGRQ